MTEREFYDAVLIEINQYGSPDFLLEDFLHYGNTAIDNYVKKRYNVYDVNQQVTDDMEALKGMVEISTTITRNASNVITGITASMTGTETKNPLTSSFNKYGIILELPERYYHTTDVIVNYTVINDKKCKGYAAGETFSRQVRRLPAGQFSMVTSLPLYRPSYRRPYFQILNSEGKTVPKILIAAGQIRPIFEFQSVDVLYVKLPNKLSLTEDQVNSTEDTSLEMEFGDAQMREIIKECVITILERFKDPSVQSKIPVSQAIAPPQGPDTQLTR